MKFNLSLFFALVFSFLFNACLIIGDSSSEDEPQVVTPQNPSQNLVKVPNQVAYYEFNGNTKDQSTNGNDCQKFGTTFVADRFGIDNRAIAFDGVDDYLDCDTSSILNITGNLTISFWINVEYTDVEDKFYEIICKRLDHSTPHSNTAPFGINFNPNLVSNGPPIIQWYYSSRNAWSFQVINKRIPNDSWVHLAFTRKVIEEDNQTLMTVYWNGKQVGVQKTLSSLPYSSPNAPLLIGQSNNMSIYAGSFFKGALDEIRIFNKTLSPYEIDSLYQKNRVSY